MDRVGWHTVTRRLLIVCLTLGAALMLAACGGDSSSAAKPAIASPIPHEAQVIAVVDEIFPEAHPGVYGYCSVSRADADCPMTERLTQRLLDEKMPICRCQNASSTRQIEVETYEGGAVAHVSMYEGRVTYDLVMVLNDDELLVDDQTCNGDAATSIYNSPVRIC